LPAMLLLLLFAFSVHKSPRRRGPRTRQEAET
jgi:hypothetical protein